MLFRAGKDHECWNITEEVMDHIGPVERETEVISNIYRGIQNTTCVRAYDKTNTPIFCHGGGIMQGFAHCCLVVISHWCQEVTFPSAKDHRKEHLSSTCIVRNDLISCKESCCYIGCDCWGVTKVHQREITQEKVHKSVKVRSNRINMIIPRFTTGVIR